MSLINRKIDFLVKFKQNSKDKIVRIDNEDFIGDTKVHSFGNQFYINNKGISHKRNVRNFDIQIIGDISHFSSSNGNIQINGDVSELKAINGNITTLGNVRNAQAINGNVIESKN